MNNRLLQSVEAWRLRAESALRGDTSLDPQTELKAAEQALDALRPTIPTMPDAMCPGCEDD